MKGKTKFSRKKSSSFGGKGEMKYDYIQRETHHSSVVERFFDYIVERLSQLEEQVRRLEESANK